MSLRIYGATSGYIELDAPAVANSASVTLPTTSGVLASYSQLKIFQTIQSIKTDTFTSAAGAGIWTDITGLSLSITPSSINNKILILFNIHGGSPNLSIVRIVRNSTPIGIANSDGSRPVGTVGNFNNTGDSNVFMNYSMTFLDSPQTTSNTTYKLQVANETTNTFCLNRTTIDTNNATGPRVISTITAIEVA